MHKLFGVLLICIVCSCSNDQDKSPSGGKTDTISSAKMQEPAGADAAAGNSVLTGSMAGYYVESFAGANTHSYEFKFRNGGYTGVYEEHQDGANNRIILKDVIGDETAKTFTFDQNGVRLTGTITAAGFQLGEEMFERREEAK